MRNQLNERLRALKAEFEAGQKMLAELEQQRVSLEQKLLRISGGIQVLAEELEKAGGDGEGRGVDSGGVEEDNRVNAVEEAERN